MRHMHLAPQPKSHSDHSVRIAPGMYCSTRAIPQCLVAAEKDWRTDSPVGLSHLFLSWNPRGERANRYPSTSHTLRPSSGGGRAQIADQRAGFYGHKGEEEATIGKRRRNKFC